MVTVCKNPLEIPSKSGKSAVIDPQILKFDDFVPIYSSSSFVTGPIIP